VDKTAATPSERDRFVCRREGHVPVLRITRQNATTQQGATYITSCQRCGKLAEFPMPEAK